MNVVVVGAGFAGLAAAIDLQEKGHSVLLLERRGVLGGRATSYRDAVSGEDVDNGTHFMVGAYRATLELVRRAGAGDLLEAQPALRLDFADDRGLSSMRCAALPGTLHLLPGLRSLGLSWRACFDAVRLAWNVRFGSPPSGLTVDQWFDRTGQDEEIRRALWVPIVKAVVNEETSRAAALLFHAVFRETFLRGRDASTLVFLKAGFGVLQERLAAHLIARGGVVRRRAAARSVGTRDGRVMGVDIRQSAEGREAILAGQGAREERIEANAVVLAVPPAAARELAPETVRDSPPFANLAAFGESPIVSVEVWLDRIVVPEPLIGLRDETVEWVIDKGRLFGRQGAPQHLSFVISAARDAASRPNPELAAAAEKALRRYFAAMKDARVERFLVLREPAATFASRPVLEALRPGPITPVAGLFLAGDWTATGLPATIEGAVRSGFEAARCLSDSALASAAAKGTNPWADERSA